MLQRIAVYQVVGVVDQEDDVDVNAIADLAGSISAEDIQLFYQIALLGRRDLHLAPDPRSGVEMTLLRMLTFRPGGEAGQAGGGTVSGNAPKVSVPAPVKAKTQAAPADEPGRKAAVTGTSWQEPVWADLINHLSLSGFNKQLASNCAYLRRELSTVFLSLDSRSESYLTRPRQAALSEALSTHFGEDLKVDIAIAAGAAEVETPTQMEARQETEELEAARVGLEADPNVKALKDMFGAELVPESVEPLSSKSAASQE